MPRDFVVMVWLVFGRLEMFGGLRSDVMWRVLFVVGLIP